VLHNWLLLESLCQDEVHLWVAGTETPYTNLPQLIALLSPAEQAQADRLKFEAHRRRFLVTRAYRRQILSRYVGTPAGELDFLAGPRGKPELACEGDDGIQFNESASEGVAVYALARGRAVGVDVERLRHVADAYRLIESFASPLERAFFGEMRPANRQAAFLRWWTAKEAYVKALGEGLSRPLKSFSITLQDGRIPRLVDPGRTGTTEWHLETLEPEPGYIGCLALAGSPPRLSRRRWP
jgi:4'-phosphopantetheinyl transferase